MEDTSGNGILTRKEKSLERLSLDTSVPGFFDSPFENGRGPPKMKSRLRTFIGRSKMVVRLHILTVLDLNGRRTAIFKKFSSLFIFFDLRGSPTSIDGLPDGVGIDRR